MALFVIPLISGVVKDFSQCEHLNGLSPVWVLKWTFRLPFSLNVFRSLGQCRHIEFWRKTVLFWLMDLHSIFPCETLRAYGAHIGLCWGLLWFLLLIFTLSRTYFLFLFIFLKFFIFIIKIIIRVRDNLMDIAYACFFLNLWWDWDQLVSAFGLWRTKFTPRCNIIFHFYPRWTLYQILRCHRN